MSSYRLKTGGLFIRNEELDQEKPKRIIFLSVEGNVTEKQYFKWVDKYRSELGIVSVVHVHVLSRGRKDTRSSPFDVVDLLEECIATRNGQIDDLLSPLLGTYTIDFIRQYFDSPKDLPKDKVREFENELLSMEIDLHYKYFLNTVCSDDDIFGVVIDRDHKNHTLEQMEDLAQACKKNGYRLFISNPCFELWLLLHVCDIERDLKNDIDKILENDKVSHKHTYVSSLLQSKVGHSKEIPEGVFLKYYLNNIDTAIERAQAFSNDVFELSGLSEEMQNTRGTVGTNVQDVINLLREPY